MCSVYLLDRVRLGECLQVLSPPPSPSLHQCSGYLCTPARRYQCTVSYHTQACLTASNTPDPPTDVSVSGPSSALPEDLVTLQCETFPSVPAAALHWVVIQEEQRVEYSTENMVEQMEDGSWCTRSWLEFTLGQGGDAVVECHAKHEAFSEDSLTFAHVITVGRDNTSKLLKSSL